MMSERDFVTSLLVLNDRSVKLNMAAKQLPVLDARVEELVKRHMIAKSAGNRAVLGSVNRKLSVVAGVRHVYRMFAYRMQEALGNMVEDLVLMFHNAGLLVAHNFFVDTETYRNVYMRHFRDDDDDADSDEESDEGDLSNSGGDVSDADDVSGAGDDSLVVMEVDATVSDGATTDDGVTVDVDVTPTA